MHTRCPEYQIRSKKNDSVDTYGKVEVVSGYLNFYVNNLNVIANIMSDIILNKELKMINFKTENYKKQIDNEKPSLQQEQKQYSLLCKQKRKLERRNKRKR